MTTAQERAFEQLLDSLDLEQVDDDHYRGAVYQEEGRLFGGLILAQAVMAAGRTATKGGIHSLHAYFLRAGKAALPVEYTVERIREGRTFLTRRVTAIQGGDAIFEASIGFTLPEEGIAYQEAMPPAPDPEGQPSWWETISGPPRPPGRPTTWVTPIDIRAGEVAPATSPGERLPYRAVWAKPVAELPGDPLVHAAVMAFMSDSGMVGTVAAPYRIWGPPNTAASLDHAMWWHRPPRFDDWILYVTESPAAHAARAIMFGGMWTRAGERVASVAQEALFRRAPAGG